MKYTLIALIGLLPLTVLAADDDRDARLRAAELRLEQAAQEIAELSAEMAGDSLKHVIKTVRHGGTEGRAMLGIHFGRIEIRHDDGSIERSGMDPDGLVIHAVTPGGPADEAGLLSGDVILAFNDTALVDGSMPPQRRLSSLIDNIAPGDTVTLRYRRSDMENTVQVITRDFGPTAFAFGGPHEKFEFHVDGEEIAEGFSDMMEHFPRIAQHRAQHRIWRGLELMPLTPGLGSYFGTDKGLLVVAVPDDGAIALEEGDVIMAIAGATPASPPEAMRLLRFYQPGDEVVMEIRRQKRNKTVKLTIPK